MFDVPLSLLSRSKYLDQNIQAGPSPMFRQQATNGVAGWLVANALTDTWSLAVGTWGWVPLEYFDLNILIERAEREVHRTLLRYIAVFYAVLN